MSLESAFYISQLIAVVALIPSIIFLALQVGQNTAQLKAGARYQFVEATGRMHALTAGSPQVASVFRRGLDDFEALDDDERMQFMIFGGHLFQIYSTMFELHGEGLLPDSQWHNVRKDIISLLGAAGGRHVWERFGKEGLDPKFVSHVEALTRRHEASYDMTKI